MLASGSRSLGLGVLLAASAMVAASCGGSTKDNARSLAGAGGQAGDAGSSGSGGVGATNGNGGASGRGGASGNGGVSGRGGANGNAGAIGSGTEGIGAAGGSAGTSGTGGSGGDSGLPTLCELPADPGGCDAIHGRYYHNVKTGVCEPFIWGGCGGNENKFTSLAACQAACRGGTPDMDACTNTAECTLAHVGCCAGCESDPGVGLVGINFRHSTDYETVKACNVACGACPPVDELETQRQYFVSTCVTGACTVVDIRTTPVTECTQDQHCALRDSARCCDECDGRGLVSVRRDVNQELMCDGVQGCPPCVGIIPPEFAPRCLEGRCAVTRVAP